MSEAAPPDKGDRQSASETPGLLEPVILWGTLLGIVLIAVAATLARLAGLNRYPGGLAGTEADHALRAREAVDFGLGAALESASDLSMPLVSGIALLGAFTGFDEVTPRAVAAVAGGISILFTGLWLRRELGLFWGIAGAGVLASSFWHVVYSRIAIAPISGALAVAAMLWFLSMALRSRGNAALSWHLLLGVAVGAGFFAAPGLRLLPLVVVGTLAVAVYRERKQSRRPDTRNWLIATIATLLTIVPFLNAPTENLSRWTPWALTPGLPNEDRATLLTLPGAVIDSVTGLALPAGEARAFNLPDDPWFSLFLLPWAIIGFLGLISASNDPALQRRFIAGGSGLAALLIGISAVDAGHPGQYVLISPLLAGLVVYGFRTAVDWARMPTVRAALTLLVVAGIGVDAYASWDQYRNDWATAPETRAAFNADLVQALHAVEELPPGEPVFVNVTGHETLLAYLETTHRRHTFDGSRALPFPAREDGFLLTPHASPIASPLEQLLAEVPSVTDSRENAPYGLYRLDDRARQLVPFGVPTIRYDAGPALYGGRIAEVEDGAISVLVAWNLPAESEWYRMDLRISGVESDGQRSPATVAIPPNPLTSRLNQVVVAEVELPREVEQFDLGVRLRDADGEPLQTGGADQDGFVFLNRYELPQLSSRFLQQRPVSF